MKAFLLFLFSVLLAACSGWQPYKDQSLEYLKSIEQNPEDYIGKVVSFSGEVKGITEDIHTLRLVLKTDVPFYYAALGKTNAYELILVDYAKPAPAMSGLEKGHDVKVLARVSHYEKRKNMIGAEIGVLRLDAFALTDRSQKKDFFHETSPEKQLYESWRKGRLFYQETPAEIEVLYPSPQPGTPTQSAPQPAQKISPAAHEIVYDEEEDFVLAR